ncbi:MAG: T9SS type A sorting domain-containing protein, partial [Bernardetiaceae bacterium]|nr:T9SS type A sorting domain-containing protein [Bernardetiaceae bacterium]
ADQTVTDDELMDYTGMATADDNCSVSVTQTPVAGTILTDTTTIITLTATDASGNSVDCSFEVTVTITPPTGGGGGSGGFTPSVQPVGNFIAVAQSPYDILLSWTASPNAERYALYRQKEGTTEWVRVAVLSIGVREFLDTGLEPDTYYRYRLDARLTNTSASRFAREATYPEEPVVTILRPACSDNPRAQIGLEGTHKFKFYNWYLTADDMLEEPFATTQGVFTTPPVDGQMSYYVTAVGQKYESRPRTAIDLTLLVTPVSNFTSLTTGRFQFSCEGFTTIEVEDMGEDVTYRWQYQGRRIAETTEPRLEVSREGAYAVVISRGGCPFTSENILVKLNHVPEARIVGTRFRFCDEGLLRAAVVTEGTYEWYKDGQSIGITDTNHLTITESGNYKVKVTQYGCEAYSNEVFAEVLVLPTPEELAIQLSSDTYCPDEEVSMTTVQIPGAVYRWTRDGNNVGNFQGNNLSFRNREASGTWRVRISFPGLDCYVESEGVEITFLDAPIVRVHYDRPMGELALEFEREEPYTSIEWFYDFRGVRTMLPEYDGMLRIVPNRGQGHYGAYVTYANGCTATSTAFRFFPSSITGTDKEESHEVNIYPNPAHDFVTLTGMSQVFRTGDVLIEVYDGVGRLILSKHVSSSDLQSDVQIELSHWSLGSYTLRLTGDAHTIIKKLIKE